ncbi:MAG: hypothetical protein ACYC5K_02435 [Saccharofermentanales bacterium]
MKDETIDEKIERLVNELETAKREKAHSINKDLLPVGTKVYVLGEIEEVDADDKALPYSVWIKGSNEHFWFGVESVKEIK